jgi:5-formyltetrahydrofolate cyclo-ligase
MTGVNVSKAELRRRAREISVGLPDASAQICAHLETFIREHQARVVLGYRAFRDEPQLERLVAALSGISFLTTRAGAGGRLSLHGFQSATMLNRFGILEPPEDAVSVEPAIVDLVLVPGLLFTTTGDRLGYGGGYYDRLLPGLRPDIPRVGIARQALIVPTLPIEPFDAPMTHLCSETGVLECENR